MSCVSLPRQKCRGRETQDMNRPTLAFGLVLFAATAASAQHTNSGFDIGVVASDDQAQSPARWGSSWATGRTSATFVAPAHAATLSHFPQQIRRTRTLNA